MLKYKKNKVINFRMLQQKYKIIHNQNRKKLPEIIYLKEENIRKETFHKKALNNLQTKLERKVKL